MEPISQLILACVLAGVVVPAAASAADAPETILRGSPQLYTVRGEVGLGRPTRYVTLRTVKGISARLLVVRVSGSSGRTFNAEDGRSDRRQHRSRTCFRSSMNPYQRTPQPRRLKPGVAYKVRFYVRGSLNGPRTLFATRTLRARSYDPTAGGSGGPRAPSPCSR